MPWSRAPARPIVVEAEPASRPDRSRHPARSHEAAAFVGDSVSDIEAARAAGIGSIGYANKPGKRERLADAGATFVIDDVRALAEVSAIAL